MSCNKWRFVGADGGGTTSNSIIPLVTGIINCKLYFVYYYILLFYYNKIKHNTRIIILKLNTLFIKLSWYIFII